MRHDQHLVTESWADYKLLDSGENMKLERWGEVVTARPETQALWAKRRPELWRDAQATFASEAGKGTWRKRDGAPEEWAIAWENVRMTLRLTAFKHTGLFPEQAPNWSWVIERIRGLRKSPHDGDLRSPHILNLFGYTGIASIAAAQAGAKVTHVDASKQSLDWAHENARLSGLPEDAIRWIPDDALAFVKREARREAKYDGIILDPPAFGRGPKGEVWKMEDDLTSLLSILAELLSSAPGAFFLVNGYAAGYAPRSLSQAVESAFGAVEGESGPSRLGGVAEAGELHIKEASGGRVIPSGIYCRFVR